MTSSTKTREQLTSDLVGQLDRIDTFTNNFINDMEETMKDLKGEAHFNAYSTTLVVHEIRKICDQWETLGRETFNSTQLADAIEFLTGLANAFNIIKVEPVPL